MDDTTNTATSENLSQEIVAGAEALYDDAKEKLEQIAELFENDVWPFVKAGFLQLLTIAGKAALQAEVAAVPLELSGDEVAAAAAVGAAITSAVATNAGAVAETEGKEALAAIAADTNSTVPEQVLASSGEQAITNVAPITTLAS